MLECEYCGRIIYVSRLENCQKCGNGVCENCCDINSIGDIVCPACFMGEEDDRME